MMFDKNCKYHSSCGADMCHGEGVCRDFEKGKARVIRKKKSMTRLEYIRNMTIEEMAEKLTELNITDAYCKGDCEESKEMDRGTGCCLPENEKQCCIRWLNKEMEGSHEKDKY